MGRETNISWTDSTWNAIRGCSRVSEGCRHCYAESIAHRFSGPGLAYEGLVQLNAEGKSTGKWNGNIKFLEEHLLDPLRWKKPRRIFVNSMSDLLHDNVTESMLDHIANVMVLAHWHTFQILTKRPQNFHRLEVAIKKAIVANMELQEFGGMATRLEFRAVDMRRRDKIGWPFPLPNIHLGVSVEDQKAADLRIPLLLQTPAAVRFISAEPLLGAIDLNLLPRPDEFHRSPYGWMSWLAKHLHWAIVGGESGHGARPMHPNWARSLRDQCKAAGVPFFFKQWGEWLGAKQDGATGVDGPATMNCTDESLRVGTKAAGCLLDGVEHHEFPAVLA